MTATQRRDYSGAAVPTTILSGINSSVTTITVTDYTGWPVGANGPFYIVIDPGLAGEEKVLILSRSAGTLTVVTSPSTGRGADGTTASAHSAGAVVYTCGTATDLDDANDHIYTTSRDDHTQYLNTARHDITGRHAFGAALGTPTAAADVATAAGTGSGTVPARSDHVHKIGAGAINSAGMFAAGVVDAAAIATDAVGTAEIAADAVTSSEIATDAVGTAEIAADAVTSSEIATDAVGSAEIAAGAVTASELASDAVTTAKILDANVTAAKLAADATVSLARGWMASSVSTTDQTGITSIVNVTGMSAPLVAVASRRYKTTVHIPRIQQQSSAGEVQVFITDSANAQPSGQGESFCAVSLAAGGVTNIQMTFIETGLSAGAHARKVRISTSAGNLDVPGSTHPGLILCEDIGPA